MTVPGEIPTIQDIREILGPALADSEAGKAVVFGSYARGEADERSDLDMLIVADTDKRFLQRIEDYWPVFRAWRRLRKGFDLLVYTPDEISNMLAIGNTFIHRALSEGVVIYERRDAETMQETSFRGRGLGEAGGADRAGEFVRV